MLMMRLQRIGRRNDPSFRVVVTDKRNGPRAGNHADVIGSYNPKMSNFQIDEEKAKHWLAQGVQPSDTVHNHLVSKGIIDAPKKNVLPKKSPIVAEKPEEETKEEAPASEVEVTTPEEAPVEEKETEETSEAEAKEEKPVEEEKAEEAPAEETKEETEAPVEEEKKEQEPEEKAEDAQEGDTEEKKEDTPSEEDK